MIADRWYRQGNTVSAYSLSFIPIEVIAGQGLDLNREQELKTFLETAVYSGEYGSACALTYTTTGNFTAVKYVLSHDSAFILVQETIYGRERQILVSSNTISRWNCLRSIWCRGRGRAKREGPRPGGPVVQNRRILGRGTAPPPPLKTACAFLLPEL